MADKRENEVAPGIVEKKNRRTIVQGNKSNRQEKTGKDSASPRQTEKSGREAEA